MIAGLLGQIIGQVQGQICGNGGSSFIASMNFSDPRNSMYSGVIAGFVG